MIYLNQLKKILFTPKKSSGTPTKIPQIVRKRDNIIRTFSPLDNNKKPSILESINKYEDINLDNINMLINRIYYEITEDDNIVDVGNDKKIYFKDLINFLHDIRNGEINDFNKEIKYEKRLKDTEVKLAKRTKFSDYAKLYERYINMLKRELFTPKKSHIPIKVPQNIIKIDEFGNQKGSGMFAYQNKFVKLSTLLTQLLTKNNSKKLKDDINQILKELYNSKQITKQVYNILNKSII